ncbi:MAG TPA: glycosyltransferase family 4 protein [Caulobacteraceae bacterium]|nr:glycosyltransferase family 4 protein [Caulobacteraceae bacterium]
MIQDRPQHVLVLSSHAPSLINFRGPLLSAIVAAGMRVTAVAPDFDGGTRSALAALGVDVVEIATARTGMNPISDLAYRQALIELFRRLKPDVLLAYTVKPVIWGILAARTAGVPRVVAMITGLGYAFTAPLRPSLKQFAVSLAARMLYRLALPRADHVLFQNPDDRDLFRSLGFTPRPERVSVTAGSGIDLVRFAPSPQPDRPSFLMLARLLKAKGVAEYAAAAKRLKVRYPDVEFRLAGPFDHGPDVIAASDLKRWVADGVSYLGALTEVRAAIADAAVFVLPSYREGTPRSVLEALATGRAVVTTDTPGCRETVTEGLNGFLVPPRDAVALEAAMERFLLDPSLIPVMGRASLALARSKYDVNQVNAEILAVLRGD